MPVKLTCSSQAHRPVCSRRCAMPVCTKGPARTIEVDVVGAALNEGAAAHALGRLCAVSHLHGQPGSGSICND